MPPCKQTKKKINFKHTALNVESFELITKGSDFHVSNVSELFLKLKDHYLHKFAVASLFLDQFDSLVCDKLRQVSLNMSKLNFSVLPIYVLSSSYSGSLRQVFAASS